MSSSQVRITLKEIASIRERPEFANNRERARATESEIKTFETIIQEAETRKAALYNAIPEQAHVLQVIFLG